jgi:predicted double-glycine peptidase
LHYYLGIPTSEAEMIRLTRPDLDTGTSFLGMEEAATAKGCVAGSFQMSYEKLKEQLATYPTPVIVRTLNPEPHFSLVLAVETDYVIVADPAIGNVLLPPKAFLSRWLIPKTQEGYVFMAVGPEPQANKAQINTAHSVQIAQELREQVRKLKAMRPPTPAFRR